MKPRNQVATDPLLKKGHAHRSSKDYDRKKLKTLMRKDLAEQRSQSNNNKR